MPMRKKTLRRMSTKRLKNYLPVVQELELWANEAKAQQRAQEEKNSESQRPALGVSLGIIPNRIEKGSERAGHLPRRRALRAKSPALGKLGGERFARKGGEARSWAASAR